MWPTENDRGRPVLPTVKRDALWYLASESRIPGSIAPMAAVMTVTRAFEDPRSVGR